LGSTAVDYDDNLVATDEVHWGVKGGSYVKIEGDTTCQYFNRSLAAYT
jgi:hypothetical protein